MQTPTINHVVPAQPGYFLLSPCYENCSIIEASREPVIAFAIDSDGATHPVTLHSVEDHGDPATLTPAGDVISYGQTWETEADWLADQQAAHGRRA